MLDCYKNATLPELEKELARIKKKIDKYNFKTELNSMAKRSTRIAVSNHGIYMLSNSYYELQSYINKRKNDSK